MIFLDMFSRLLYFLCVSKHQIEGREAAARLAAVSGEKATQKAVSRP
jgi:hypothetical protein